MIVWSKLFEKNMDAVGLIGHKREYGLDHGDCPHRMGLYVLGLVAHNELEENKIKLIVGLNALHVGNGITRRHYTDAPDCGKPGTRDFACWSNPKVMSRDQTTPLLIASSFVSRRLFKELVWRLAKRGFFSQNFDPPNPSHIGAIVRASGLAWLKPLLYLTDMFLLIGILIDWIKHKIDPKDTSDVVMGCFLLVQAYLQSPTFLIRWSIRLAKGANYVEGFNYYFNTDPGSPPFVTMYKSILKGVFNGA